MNKNISLWLGIQDELGEGKKESPSLTPYLLDGNGPYPVMIVMPGGGYHSRSYHEGELVAQWLNGIGVSAYVLNYQVAPAEYPAQFIEA
ncbi:hypothetical protein ACIQZI_08675 [Peribacillus sp. NPDC096379]|uniref:hypothetical protein n=1 Tax=Peribacillus sp. NPDC096379 TaxID=3364393 RepID=UPI00381DFF22